MSKDLKRVCDLRFVIWHLYYHGKGKGSTGKIAAQNKGL